MCTLGPSAIRQISSISYKEVLACTAPTASEECNSYAIAVCDSQCC